MGRSRIEVNVETAKKGGRRAKKHRVQMELPDKENRERTKSVDIGPAGRENQVFTWE
ncbi:MAG: hypothetical protein JRJ47_13285 [Deltaproteobacteria bacterium]|jgi:hypothetical protein|nr:hypothetical protein [Deltaproteobacteria bacterium]